MRNEKHFSKIGELFFCLTVSMISRIQSKDMSNYLENLRIQIFVLTSEYEKRSS
jgi:hypothetical protein